MEEKFLKQFYWFLKLIKKKFNFMSKYKNLFNIKNKVSIIIGQHRELERNI